MKLTSPKTSRFCLKYRGLILLMVTVSCVAAAGVLVSNQSSDTPDFVANLIEKFNKVMGAKEDKPIFLSGSIEPKKVAPGDEVVVTIEIKDEHGIEKVTADMGGIETIELKLIEGNEKQGTWQGKWIAYDTEPRNYQTMVYATNVLGKQSTMSINWEDPTITDSFTDTSYIAATSSVIVDTTAGQVELSATETLRPDAAGAYTNIDNQAPDSGEHWEKVDEASPDGDSTLLWTRSTTQLKDAFNLGASSIPEAATINSVRVYFVYRSSAPAASAYCQPFLRLGANESTGTEVSTTNTTYHEDSEVLSKPGGGAWSVSDLADLQVAIGVRISNVSYINYLTQVYVAVDYIPPTGTLTSTNLLSGETVSSIDSFGYNATSVPPGTYLKAQFSNDDTNWKNSASTPDAWDTQSEGSDSIDLSGLGWTGDNFYYKERFESTQASTTGLWHFDEGSGTTTADSSGNGNDGTIHDPSTKLLLHANGADESTTFTDSSLYPHTVTANADAQIDTAQSKFGGSSGLFNGTTDYLTADDHADWTFGSGDFTIDGWIRLTDSLVTDEAFVAHYQSGSAFWEFYEVSSKLGFYAYDSGGTQGYYITTNAVLSADVWHHVAVVRSGSTCYLFVDGDSKDVTINNAFATLGDIVGSLAIGRLSTANAQYVNGWLDEFRISKGIARWTSDFTPPSAEYPAMWKSGDDCKFGSCLSFDGVDDYVSVPDSDDWNFGTGDFTIEAWVRLNTFPGHNDILSQYTDVSNYWRFYIASGGTLQFVDETNGTFTCPFTPSINTWYHLAFVRNGSNTYMFIDGVSKTVTEVVAWGTMPDLAADLHIGEVNSSDYFDGRLDEVRIIKGTALTQEQILADYAVTKGFFGGNKFEYYITGGDNQTNVNGIYWRAQTFTPSTAHKITSVKLKAYRVGNPGTITIGIRATSGGLPTGDDLCSGTTSGDTLTETTTGEWREITLGAGYNLSADTKYAIVVRGLGSDASNRIWMKGDATSPTYSGGSVCLSSDSGSSWSEATTWDFMFEDWGDSGGTPVLDEVSVDYTSWTPRPPGISPSGGGFLIF